MEFQVNSPLAEASADMLPKQAWSHPTITIFESFDTSGAAKASTGREAAPTANGPS
jgi:hypothetical protein